jgi:aspartyl-tRNA(Asn)/glutamyl-tRNA(Gln) amidotransferase subunit C
MDVRRASVSRSFVPQDDISSLIRNPTQKFRSIVSFLHMSLTREDVLKLAELSRLELSEDEAGAMEKQLDSILGYVDRLQQIDTKNVEPATMPARAEGWRKDEEMTPDAAARELILSNFPSRKGDLLHTPGVFEKPKK